MILPADQFIERFLWHVLPKRYHRIRHYGFLTNGKKKANLEIIREFFKSEKGVQECAEIKTTDDTDGITCPKCKKGKLRPFLEARGVKSTVDPCSKLIRVNSSHGRNAGYPAPPRTDPKHAELPHWAPASGQTQKR